MADSAHRAEIGGKGEMWHQVGDLQFDFLVSQGLKPEHTLLDVGCGSLRGGVRFIPYLNPGNYYGIEKQAWLVDAGLLLELNSSDFDRVGEFNITDDFTIPDSWPRFDFAIAQSLFPHLPAVEISRCIRRVCRHLSPNGQFFATFFNEGKFDDPPDKVLYPGGITAFKDRDPWFHSVEFLSEMATELGFQASWVGRWNHPRGQELMRFYR